MRQTALSRHLATPKAKLMARVGEEFPLECPGCGGDIRLIAFITEPGPIRKILTHLGEPLEPPPVSPARGPPTDWGELVQGHDGRAIFQASPDELPVIRGPSFAFDFETWRPAGCTTGTFGCGFFFAERDGS
ncbi:MAG: hypothetical protein ACKO1M_01800 [Planctomycetota bacterium]